MFPGQGEGTPVPTRPYHCEEYRQQAEEISRCFRDYCQRYQLA
jgi:hypothetical protein